MQETESMRRENEKRSSRPLISVQLVNLSDGQRISFPAFAPHLGQTGRVPGAGWLRRS